MGKYSVPESIRRFKPKGTMVKAISGKYYVYEFATVLGEDGKRHTKMGNLIGSIREDIGFVPKNTPVVKQEVSVLEYGQYVVTMANSQSVLEKLKKCFNPLDAITIYAIALIHFVNGFTYMKDISNHYEMSYLALKYPGLKLGYSAVAKLYDALGRRQGQVIQFEQMLCDSCSSKQIALDGHSISSTSVENDLSEKGNMYLEFGCEQLNLLMAYDINTESPLFSKIYEGGNLDKISISDFINIVELKDMLFIMDAGFYSSENVKIFSKNNSYIIPPMPISKQYREVVAKEDIDGRFVYRANKKNTIIEYKQIETKDGQKVFRFKDVNLAALSQSDFLLRVDEGKYPAYTMERFEELKDSFGIIVLQTNLENKTPQEIYELYKKRWKIETYYDYFKNGANFKNLHSVDYYKTQGLAFIMLVTSLIYREFKNATKAVKTKHVEDILLETRMVKIHRERGVWTVNNCKNTLKQIFSDMKTELII